MSSRIFFRVMLACALLAPMIQLQRASALDRVFDGGPAGTGTDYYTGANWAVPDTVPTAQFSQRPVIGTTGVNTPVGVGLLTATVTASTTPPDPVSLPAPAGNGNYQGAGLVLGREPTSSGTLNVVTGGTVRYAFTAQSGTAGANGAVYLGLFNSGPAQVAGGIGHLNISGTGRLFATGLFVEGETVGADRSSVDLSGSAAVTLGPVLNVYTNTTNNIGADNLRFGRNLTITGPNVNFTNTGNLAILSTNSYTANITSATAHSPIKSTGNVALGGTLNVNFSGLVSNPVVGQTWNLIDYGGNLTGNFSNASIGSDVTVTGLPEPVELGAAFKIRRADGGTNGKLVQLIQQALLVLEINRDTGEMSITNPHGGPINIEGYQITSPLGSLLPSYKGISGAPAGDTGWEKASIANSETGLAEFKSAPFTSLNLTSIPSLTLGTGAGKGFDREAVGGDVANFGTDGEDLAFFYSTPDGPLQGHVKYVGTKFENNLVLRVNPNTGEAFLKNDSLETLSFDGYSIISSTDSLDSVGWDGLGGDWLQTDIEPDALSETNLFDSLTLEPEVEVAIGDIGAFTTDAAKDGLSMRFILSTALGGSGPLAGDHNLDGTVDAADYVTWRKTNVGGSVGYDDWRENFAAGGGGSLPEPTFRVGSVVFDTMAGSGGLAAVPEPSAAWLVLVGIVGMLAMGRSRGTSRTFQLAHVTAPCPRVMGQVEVGGGTMLRRFGSHLLAATGLCAAFISAQPAAAAPEGIPLINYDFADPGPVGVKAFAFDLAGTPVAGAIPGWTFPGPGTEDFGDDERLGDSGTEGSGGLVPDNEMLLSVNDGKAYQIASGFALRSISDDEIYKLAFDSRDIFTIDANGSGLDDSGQLTARFFYGAWAVGERTLLNQVIDLTGDMTRYEFTIPFNSPLLTAPALGQTIGVEFTTTSKDRNALVDKSWSHIDNVVMQIAPVLEGDFDGNGVMTAADYNILRGNIQRPSCNVGIRGCPFEANGEMTGDYVVDLNDFREFKTAFGAGAGGGSSTTPGNVPEPSTPVLLMLAAGVLAGVRRRQAGRESTVRNWMRALMLAAVGVGAAFVASPSAQAELYLYDPFLLPSPLTNPANPALGQYNEWTPPTVGQVEPIGPHVPLAGQNPTPQVGTRPNYFEGAWRTAGAAPGGVVHPTGIGYITTTTQGGSARNAPVPNPAYVGPATEICGTAAGSLYSSCDGRSARFLTTPYDATANETVYIAFIANFGDTEGGMGYRAVEFFPAATVPTADWSEQRFMELGYNEFFGYGNALQQNPATARVGLGTGGQQIILADAPTSYNDDGRNHLFVMRFEFSSTNNMDNVFVFMDPASTELPEIANAEFRNLNLTLGGFSTVTRYGGTAPSLAVIGELGSTGIFDELRIGNTYADVLPPGLPVPGDTDGDLDVDLIDYATIRDNFHRTDAGGPPDGDVARSDGRLGFDGKVDMGDFWLWKRKFEEAQPGGGSGLAGVPEPTTALLAIFAAASVWGWSTRRRKPCAARQS